MLLTLQNSQEEMYWGTKNDRFMSFSLGLTYSLGSKKKSMHWYNPLDDAYHTQKRIAQKSAKDVKRFG